MQSDSGTRTNLEGPPSTQYLKDRLELEGQCKVESFIFLKLCRMKGIILFILLLISVIGLLILKYSKRLRTKVFYTQVASENEATHIFIKGNSKSQEIIICLLKQGKSSYFFYRELKYELIDGQPYPVGLDFETYLQENLSEEYLKKGLRLQSVKYNSNLYGKNQHIVNPPTYFQYLSDVLTEPFFFIQYLAAVIYIVQGLSTLTFLLIGTSLITTTINYIILYLSYRKIKEMAEVVKNVQILREGQFKELPSNQLIPGDLFIPKQHLFCDAILLKGEIYANEANLTGQSVPIAKFGLQEFKNYEKGDSRIWLYEGSKILSSHNGIAVAINTGYSSKRGRILRKMLIRNVQQPHFFKTYIYFVLFSYIIGVIAYLATLSLRLNNTEGGIQKIFILLNFLLIVTFCFPPAAAVYFNLVYSFSLIRLKFNDILGTQPQKTVESTHLKIICFDKTGTLTVDKMQVNRIITFQPQSYKTLRKQENRLALDFKLFGCCHTVRQFEQKLQGDEIDLKTFQCSGFKLLPSSQQSVCFEVREDFGLERLRVLKIFQYESKFQSMAVLAHDKQTNKFFVFTKGAPQIIHTYSKVKYPYFQHLLQSQSYSGFRTIGYGYKQIPESHLQQCLRVNRQSYMKDITMLGLLVFENKLKNDSKQTIQQLRTADISPRMITGDNIYIAIETSMRCGILTRSEQVCVLQGKFQNIGEGQREQQLIIKAKFLKFQNLQVRVRQQSINYDEYLNSNYSIIIDNDFLKRYSRFQLSQNIKVFARISPQNKAYIVRNIRKNLQAQSQPTNWFDKLLNQQSGKVGMVGDGANDLLAIKQANIGIGISNCDSSYAASFSVNCLKNIGYLIRQAKCAQREIIQICRFISISGILSIPQIIIMELEGAYFSPLQMAINNFSKSLILPILVAFSRPSNIQTNHKPCSNFLQKQNQLSVWGNVLLSTLVISANYIYYSQTDEYVKNTVVATMQTGWSFNNSLVASQYLYTSIQPVILTFCLYSSDPWKQPIFKNIPLFIVIFLNVAYQTTLYFIQPQLADFLGMPKISYPCLIKLLIISNIGNVLVFLWSKMIQLLRLHEKRKICLQKKSLGQMIRTGSSSQNHTQN